MCTHTMEDESSDLFSLWPRKEVIHIGDKMEEAWSMGGALDDLQGRVNGRTQVGEGGKSNDRGAITRQSRPIWSSPDLLFNKGDFVPPLGYSTNDIDIAQIKFIAWDNLLGLFCHKL